MVANDLRTSIHFSCNTLVKDEVSGLRYDPVIAHSIILVRQGSCRLCCIPVYVIHFVKIVNFVLGYVKIIPRVL